MIYVLAFLVGAAIGAPVLPGLWPLSREDRLLALGWVLFSGAAITGYIFLIGALTS